MNQICRDIFRAIHEGKWLKIEYRNKADQIEAKEGVGEKNIRESINGAVNTEKINVIKDESKKSLSKQLRKTGNRTKVRRSSQTSRSDVLPTSGPPVSSTPPKPLYSHA